METANDNGDSTFTEAGRDLVGTGGLGRHRGNGHQVRFRGKIDRFGIFVNQPDLPVGRSNGSKGGKGKRGEFESQLAPQPSLGPAGGDEEELHFLFSAIYWAMLRTD